MADKDNNISFITGIKYSKDLLKQVNGMTFLFNRNWSSSDYSKATLPICCFGVTKMEEVSVNDVSTKQMLFFNTSGTTNKEKQSSGLLNVVADNIVLKPRQYKLSVVLPSDNLFMPIGNGMYSDIQNLEILRLAGTGQGTAEGDYWLSLVNLDSPALQVIKSLIKDLTINFNYNDNWFRNVTETPMFNKNSLDAMRDSRSILKFKSWEGWGYKYVVLTDVNLSKEPLDDGCFIGNITIQEMPIMSVAKENMGVKSPPFYNPVNEGVGNVIKAFVESSEIGE